MSSNNGHKIPEAGPALPFVAEVNETIARWIRTQSRRFANQELRGVTATLATQNRKRILERVRVHISIDIFLAAMREEHLQKNGAIRAAYEEGLWRTGAILARDCLVRMLNGKG